jgi:PPM family protein phosphatase
MSDQASPDTPSKERDDQDANAPDAEARESAAPESVKPGAKPAPASAAPSDKSKGASPAKLDPEEGGLVAAAARAAEEASRADEEGEEDEVVAGDADAAEEEDEDGDWGEDEGEGEGEGEEDGDGDGDGEDEEEDEEEDGGEDEETAGEIRMRLFGRTDVGQVREHNEDNFLVADLTRETRGLADADRDQVVGDRGALLAVCDGMGGAAAGEVASQLAVDIVYQRMVSGGPPLDHDDLALRLVRAVEAAGLRIFSEAKLDRTRRGMGTTATVATLLDDFLFLGQVGDSRGYILRGERLVQVTRDQSLVNQLIEAGQLTEEEAETFEHNNIILQALGTADTVQVDLTFVDLRRGDTLLLCSDGLSGMVRNDEIREVLRTIDDPKEACRELTDRANQAGGHDNVTVVVAKFDGDGLRAASPEDVEGLTYRKYELPESPAHSLPPVEPSRRVKELDQAKISLRPSSRPPPDIELHDEDGEWDEYEDDLVAAQRRIDEPIHIPTDRAPQWLVTMMIVSALTCVLVAGYYLLR